MVNCMKRYILFLGIIMIFLVILNIEPSYGKEDYVVMSHNFLNYVKKNKIRNIKGVCTVDYCDYLRSPNIERAWKLFESKYYDYLVTKMDEEKALEVILNGFAIKKIDVLE